MFVHFFTKGDKNVASSRYRGYYLAEGLIHAGHRADVYPISADFKSSNSFVQNIRFFFRYLNLLRSFSGKDEVIFLQRTVYSKYFFLDVLLARIFWGRKYIFDLDDAVFEHSFLKTFILVKLASAVTCGGRLVFDWSKKYNKNVLYFLNSLPPDIYVHKRSSTLDVPVVGWIGDGPAHFENLKLLPPIFKRLIDDGIKFKFKLVGALGDKRIQDLFGSIDGLDYSIIDSLDWSDPRNAVSEIIKFDIGIMPLIRNRWNEAKYFKTLEYMACGVPPVASDFGENQSIIEDGVTGFLADDESVWYQKLKLLILDEELRVRMGSESIHVIESKFTLNKTILQLTEFIKLVLVK